MIYIDADACPVKDEVYRVARRVRVKVIVAANAHMMVPANDLLELVVVPGFGGVDDWIASVCVPGDVIITTDIPLAARALEKGSRALDHRGHAWTADDIGEALATRALMEDLRQYGGPSRGPAPFLPKDRSKFLAKLDETMQAIKRHGK